MSFTDEIEKALEAVKKVKALAKKIEGQIDMGGELTDEVSIKLTKEEAAMACAALQMTVEGL